MSTTVDERVVSLQFDNREFEKNVSTTMNTLEKFKQKLNFKGTANGLEEVGRAANKVDMTGLSKGIENVHAQFSALQVMGVTALANITNSAVNAGKRMLSALTIDPVKTGFQEYETQINSVQTILANTKSKGSTLDDVNAALDELNKYADQTIYNFTEMTRNIGTFTAAGVDLETSTNAIQGIANLAAVSGSSSQQASTAMYQLSQALAAGRVSLMDWNSVVNAGMGGQLFQDALKKTSEELGTGAEAAIAEYGSFRDSLSKGEWLTTEVLTETLKKFTSSGANEYIAEMTGLTTEYVNETVNAAKAQHDEAKAIDVAAEALSKKSGYSKEAIYEALDFARTAQDAATKVKTFTQLWDVLKEAAQSGWTQTWELLIGDFEDAKNLLTPLADFLTNAINAMSEARNKVLGSALGKGFVELGEKVKGALEPMQKTAGALGKVADTVQDYGKIVDEIIGGKWGNGQARWDKLTKAGYDWAHAQNLVNEKLGDGTRHATKYTEAQNGVAKAQKGAADATGNLTEEQAVQLEQLIKKSDAELKSLGYTKEQIAAFRELEDTSNKLGIPIKELVTNIDEINGRWLIFNSFKNIFQPFITIFKALGKAWRSAFDPISGDDIFNVIAAFHKFSTYLVINKDAAEDLTNVFKGLFAILDIVTSITGGAFKIGFKIIQEFLKALGYVEIDILGVAGSVGKAIATFRDWLEEHNLIFIAIEKIVPLIVSFGKAVVNLVKALYKIPMVQNGIKKVTSVFKNFYDKAGDGVEKLTDTLGKLDKITLGSVKSAFGSFKDSIISACDDLLNKFDFLPDNMISGFVSGIGKGIKRISSTMLEIGRAILDTVKDYLGIHSPSTKAIEIMENFADGIIIGIRNTIQKIIDGAKTIAEPFVNLFKGIDFGKLFAGAVTSGIVVTAYKFSDALQSIAAPMEGVGSVLESVSDVIKKSTKGIAKVIKNSAKVVKSFSKVLNAYAFKVNSQALINVASALLILAGSVYLISIIDPKRLWESVWVLMILVGVMAALSFAVNKLGDSSATISREGIQIDGIRNTLINMGIAILLVAAAVKLIGGMDPEKAKQGFLGLAGVVTAMILVLAAYGQLVKGKSAQNIDKAGKMMKKMAVTMIIMIGVVKLASLLDKDDILPAVAFVGSFVLLTLAFTAISMLKTKSLDKIAGMMLKMSFAMLLMIGVVKLASLLDKDDILPAVAFAIGFTLFVAALVKVTKISGGDEIAKIGGLLLSVSVTMLIMVGVIKLLSKMDPGDIFKGVVCIVAFGLIIAGLVKLISLIDAKEMAKIGTTLLGMAVAVAILAGVAVLMGYIDIKHLAKGIIVVGILSVFMAGLATATNGASDCKGSIMAMAVAIGVMAAAIILLSFIKPEKLVGPVAALGILIGMFGLMMKLGSNVQNSMSTLIVMTVAIGVMTAAIMLLSKIPFEQALGGAAALSLLMLTLSGCMYILSTLSGTVGQALIGAAGVLALCVPLLAFVGILYLMSNVQNAITNATALILLATTMTLLLLPLTLVGSFIGAAIAGVIGLLAMSVPMLAFVGILALMNNIQNAETNANLLIKLMTTMTTCLVAISLVAPLLTVGVAALYGLVTLIGVVGVMAAAIGGLIETFPSLQSMIDTGIPLLISLAGGLGEMIGAFIGGIAEQIIDILPSVGTSLSEFSNNVQPFITSMNAVDPKILESVKILAGAILVLTAADVLEGLTSWLTGGVSLQSFGTELAGFSGGLRRFGENVSGIDPEKIKAAAIAAKTLTEMATMIPNEGGVVSLFTGENGMASFGNQIAAFGTCLKTFATNVAGVDAEAVKMAAEAGKALASMADTIPNEGGMAAWFAGENSMASFGTQIASFGVSLKTFSANVVGIDVEAIKMACEAGKALTGLANTVPNEGGMAAWFAGENSMASFGTQIASFGVSLKTFSANVVGIDVEAIRMACEAGKELTSLANTIPNEGGMKAWFSGDNSMASFAPQMVTFGNSIKKYSEAVVGVDILSISASVVAAGKLVELSKKLPENKLFKNETTIDEFGKQLPKLAKGLSKYYENLTKVDMGTLNTSISAVQKLVNMAKGLVNFDGDGMKSFGKSLEKMGKDGIDDFVSAFKDSTTKVKEAIQGMLDKGKESIKGKNDAYKSAGKKLSDSLNDGIKSKAKTIKSTTKDMVNDAANAADSSIVKSGFKEAGKDMVDGFASGISAQTFRAEAKATAMAKAALKAAKDALDINSPSKEARALGYGVPEGLAEGIDKMTYLVKGSSSSMANTALDTTGRIISKMASVIDSDIDYQPTIRPVVDLSNIKTSTGLIGNMLGGLTPSVGLMADVKSISSSIGGRLQNGTNNDIVSAIKNLGKSLGNTGGDTYNINGVTYDDGSNISNAVSTIVRAARIERRI